MGTNMQATSPRLTGAHSSARKYDVLSALALAGLEGSSLPSQRALRLIALITTRYNWAGDTLSIGHAELAVLWKVSRRTVIREVEALRQSGLLVVLRTGRKGRVTTYRLSIPAISALTAEGLQNEPTGVGGRLAGVRVETKYGPRVESEDHLHAAPRSTGDEWWNVLSRLPSTVSASQRTQWLEPLRGVRVGARLEVIADTPFRAAYVSRTFGDALRGSARTLGIDRVEFCTEAKSARHYV